MIPLEIPTGDLKAAEIPNLDPIIGGFMTGLTH